FLPILASLAAKLGPKLFCLVTKKC
uniref:Brevinin-1BYb n=1 Tax=Rana boylii TaxID=160499 RepID=BR1B_RANBO|nr:RecName: Full=Brevinin-1BYb [Rana boylii]